MNEQNTNNEQATMATPSTNISSDRDTKLARRTQAPSTLHSGWLDQFLSEFDCHAVRLGRYVARRWQEANVGQRLCSAHTGVAAAVVVAAASVTMLAGGPSRLFASNHASMRTSDLNLSQGAGLFASESKDMKGFGSILADFTSPTTQPMFTSSWEKLLRNGPTTAPVAENDELDVAPTGETPEAEQTENVNADMMAAVPATMPSVIAMAEPSTMPTTAPSPIVWEKTLPNPTTLPSAVPAPAAVTVKPDPNSMILSGADAHGQIKLMVNNSVIVTTRMPVQRVSIGQAEIADVNPVGATSLLITGKKAGATQLIVWDDNNKSQVVDVGVGFDIRALQEQLTGMFPGLGVEAASLNGAVALRGRVPNLETAEKAIAIAQPYAPKVLNFLEISGVQQVQLQVRFIEISRLASTQLGFSTRFSDGVTGGGAINGGAGTVGNGSAPNVASGVTVFGSAKVGSTALEFFISALKKNNLARVLAEPNLVASSGQEASFLAGGAVPVPVPQAGAGGGSSITIEYKEFGVKLKFVPVVLGDGKIRLKVAPEVSDLDYNNSVSVNGLPVPGFKTRKVDTTIELHEGQTFSIAGLLNRKVTASNSATPGLGELPIIGALFRSVAYERSETELVVLVTPKLVSPMNPDQVPALPGDRWRYPTDGQLLFGADLGSPDGQPAGKKPALQSDAPPARYRGEHGFTAVEEPAQPIAAEKSAEPITSEMPAEPITAEKPVGPVTTVEETGSVAVSPE